ncbi:G2-specific serine/threonine protein kinase [Paramecium bursaria]
MQQITQIEDFEVLEKLGDGSFAQVYKVKRKSDQQFYAMKKVNISLQTQKERENALNEVRILASIESPYIVEFKDSFLSADGNVLYIIMEFATGGDLNRVLQKSKPKGLDEKEIWNALVQIALGVKHLHDNGILHRDLKLANVFATVSQEGYNYKIGDLNISKVTKGANARTQAGTPYYAAPEVWKGDQYSWPCDLWSLGCIIYELSTGNPPFRAADLQSLNRRIQTGQYDPIPARFTKQLSEVIGLMLQVNPSKRPSCEQILKNPIVIKNSGQLLVESEQPNGKKVFKLLQTIKLPYNLKQLKGNLPQSKYEKRERTSSASGQRPQVPETPQPEKSKPIIQAQQAAQKPIQQQVQTPKQPPMAKQNGPISNKPPTGQPNQVRISQQEQRLIGYNNNYYQPQQVVTPRGNSKAAGIPSTGLRRQQSAGAYRRY